MELLGELAAIWRYPIKSLASEELVETTLDATGIPGDRAAALFVIQGHARAGKTYRGKENNRLHTTLHAHAAESFAKDAQVEVALRGGDPRRYFDAAPISVVFDAWVEEVARALGRALDPLRWRPNFYALSAPGFGLRERDLSGARIDLGQSVLRVREPIERCVTTTYDVQTGQSDPEVLRYIAQHRGAMLGIYCDVELAGRVRVGDSFRLRAR